MLPAQCPFFSLDYDIVQVFKEISGGLTSAKHCEGSEIVARMQNGMDIVRRE